MFKFLYELLLRKKTFCDVLHPESPMYCDELNIFYVTVDNKSNYFFER